MFGELRSRGRQFGLVLLCGVAQSGFRARNRVPGFCQLMVEGVAGGLNVGQLRAEIGFALREVLDAARRRLEIAPKLFDSALGFCQSLGKVVASRRELRYRAIGFGPMFRELGSRRRSYGVVPLFGVAQRGVRV